MIIKDIPNRLLDDKTLAWSATVANNRMNRKRKATGINSYEKDIQLNPITFLEGRTKQSDVQWLDLCCGEGNALIETAHHFQTKKTSLPIHLTGIDLVDYFGDAKGLDRFLTLKSLNLSDWLPSQKYDLITCVHGLHYVGDKLGLILKASSALKPNGLFIGNLDLENIKIEGYAKSTKLIKTYFKDQKISCQSRQKLIKIEGGKRIDSKFGYLGADDKAGPNYTGMEVVHSFYKVH